MSKQEYTWLVALSVIAARGKSNDGGCDQEDPRPLMQAIYARAGSFSNAPAKAANDLAAALLVLLFILAWNCAKYRALLRIRAQICANNFQSNGGPFLPPHPATSLVVPAFPNIEAVFLNLYPLCQMISTLTQGLRQALLAGTGR